MIHLFTTAYNRPDFIALQVRSFRKFLLDEFTFTVINSAVFDRPGDSHSIRTACADLGVACIDVQRDNGLVARCEALELRGDSKVFNHAGGYLNANVGAAYPSCWAWENFIGRRRDRICFLHSDVFLAAPIHFGTLLDEHPLCYLPQAKELNGVTVRYMWDAFILADLAKLPAPESVSLWCGGVHGVPVDVGGQSAHYLTAHPDVTKLEMIGRHIAEDLDCTTFAPANYEIFSFKGDTDMLHYRSGSNWDHKSDDYHRAKTEWLKARLGL